MTISRSGVSLHSKERFALTSTNKGAQSKFEKDRVFYKLDLNCYEGLAETIVSDILNMTNLSKQDFVIYRQATVRLNNMEGIGCASDNFLLNDNESVLTLSDMFTKVLDVDIDTEFKRQDNILDYIVDTVKDVYDINIRQYLLSCIAIDSLVLNEDRHLNNLAIVVDKSTNRARKCPIFDNGYSLLSDMGKYSNKKIYSPADYELIRPRNVYGYVDFKEQFNSLIDSPPFLIDSEKFLHFMACIKDEIPRIYNVLKYTSALYPKLFTNGQNVQGFPRE